MKQLQHLGTNVLHLELTCCLVWMEKAHIKVLQILPSQAIYLGMSFEVLFIPFSTLSE